MLDPNLQTLFNIFSQASRGNQFALENADRFPYPLLGVVTENEDPDNERKILCSIAAIPALNTYWIRRLPLYPGFDPPLPKVGETVLILCNEGDQTSMYYVSTNNKANPPLDKESAQDDWWVDIPGHQNTAVAQNKDLTVGQNHTQDIGENQSTTVGKNQNVEVGQTQTVDVTQSQNTTVGLNQVTNVGVNTTHTTVGSTTISAGAILTLQNTAGASITLTAGGAIVFSDAFGNSMALGGASAGDVPGATSDSYWFSQSGSINWHLFDNDLNIYRVGGWNFNVKSGGDVKINGKSVATLGAVDNRGDILTQKGW